ncbi:VapC toxin family PIN domain ribonuclease [Salmonella enterica subsp. enterica serovar Java]|nr:VapC toxin family PIN domain ribonuclease [Salmonella enterica subsp. enterica serovar Java]
MAEVIYLDANVLIALIEASLPLTDGQAAFVANIDSGKIVAVTSELALAECLVKPLADSNVKAVEAYNQLFSEAGNLSVRPVSRAILTSAAALRAATRLKLPDAIHLATANEAGCSEFVTADSDFKAVGCVAVRNWTLLEMIP